VVVGRRARLTVVAQASKSALEAFSRCAASEVAQDGVVFSNVLIPLTKTKVRARRDRPREPN